MSDDAGRPDPGWARTDPPGSVADDGHSAESPPVGSVIAAAREARGMSVEDVAAATRIRVSLVNAIEHDDFSGCGGTFYARGHLRTIARVVGADERAVAAAFDRRSGETPDAAARAIEASGVSPEPPPESARRTPPRWAAAAAAVVVVLAVVVVGGWLLTRSGSGAGRHGASGVATHTQHPSSHPTPTAHPTRTTPAPAPSGVQVRVQITGDRSWLLVTSSAGAAVYEGVLDSGAQMKFTDPSRLTVRFGNPLAVSVTVNGKQVGRPCPQSVCTVQFSPGSNQAG